ncbi:alpha/beta hydrolase [Paenibacillus macquariensis subsp. defensor]|nr:alpha/beta hydrolase [Paenibacillus macquariensis subsp. defensor]
MKRKWMKILKISIVFIVLVVVVALIFPTWTPEIKGDHSISTLEQVQINGTGQEVMIRGMDTRNPIVIFVHGGPGSPEIPYVSEYNDLLEKNFTIVHYDQRGSGKSYHFFEDYSNLSGGLLVDDLLLLTDYVREKFGQDKVLLVGHSYGTYIGIQAAAKAPDKFVGYIGIGQVSDLVKSELDGLEYSLGQAKAAGNIEDGERLEKLRGSIERGETVTPRDLVGKYGGASRLFDDNHGYLLGFPIHHEYNLLDVLRYYKGNIVSQELLMPEILDNNITSIVDRLTIPSYFVMGKYDYMTSANVAREYFDKLEAPVKEFVLFEKSAHYPQFEEEEKFAEWLNNLEST